MVQTKEQIAKTKKEYYEKNKEKIKEQRGSETGKMINKINQWKFIGLVCENREEYEYIYDRWLNSETCEERRCNKEYTKKNKKCMDHCHDSGIFRNILCNSCNMKRRTKDNSCGIPNISKNGNNWTYRIQINGEIHRKYSEDLEWLKQYKIDYENKYLYNN